MSDLGVSAQSVFLAASTSMNFSGSTRSSSLAQAVVYGERKVGRGSWLSALGAAEGLARLSAKACLGRSGGCCVDGSTLAAFWSPRFLFSPQAVPAVTPVDEESSDGEPDQEAVQR